MTGHAPGPWRVEYRGEGQGIAVMAHDPTYPVARAFGHYKYVSGKGYTKLFDANANARLIAAASNRSGAAKRWLFEEDLYNVPPRQQKLDAIRDLRAAIAEAEGGS